MELHPEFLTKDGKRQFAVLPYEEFLVLQELLDDMEDLMDLRAAKQDEIDRPTTSLADVKQSLDRQ